MLHADWLMLPLAAELGLDRLDGYAIRLRRAISAAFADRRVDQQAHVRIVGKFTFASSAQFRRASLDIDDGGNAFDLAQFLHEPHRCDRDA